MTRKFPTRIAGAVLLSSVAACSGQDDPEPCLQLPACITGSTWNAAVCACILDDEPGDGGKADRAVEMNRDSGSDEASESDPGPADGASD